MVRHEFDGKRVVRVDEKGQAISRRPPAKVIGRHGGNLVQIPIQRHLIALKSLIIDFAGRAVPNPGYVRLEQLASVTVVEIEICGLCRCAGKKINR